MIEDKLSQADQGALRITFSGKYGREAKEGDEIELDGGWRYRLINNEWIRIGSPSRGEKQIKMSLETARELAKVCAENDGAPFGTLSKFLLENFTLEELTEKKGYTWEESFSHPSYRIDEVSHPKAPSNVHNFKTKEQAESALAFAQLSHIVARYNQGKSSEVMMIAIMPSKDGLRMEYMKKEQNQFGLDFHDPNDAETSMQVNKELWLKYWLK